MPRLNIDRQKKLEPLRMETAVNKISALGYEIIYKNEVKLIFIFKGKMVYFFPYTGWHTGLKIKDGRGLSKLLKQIQP